MKGNTLVLFLITVVVWGSTWFVIKFQLTTVDPLWSIAYRFSLGGILLLLYAKIRKIPLYFDKYVHRRMMLQGILLFGFNYWFVYLAEVTLNSGLMAVLFSGIVFLNILFQKIFLGRSAQKKVYWGSLLGLIGTFFIFYQQLNQTAWHQLPLGGILFGIASVTVASLGNVTAAANQARKIPVIPLTAYGMIYGAVLMVLLAILLQKPIAFDFTSSYLLSLIYLSLFGSVIAFVCYLTLIGTIGPDKAAYTLVVIPIVSLMISTLWEGYRFEWYALIGVLLIISGNFVIMRR